MLDNTSCHITHIFGLFIKLFFLSHSFPLAAGPISVPFATLVELTDEEFEHFI